MSYLIVIVNAIYGVDLYFYVEWLQFELKSGPMWCNWFMRIYIVGDTLFIYRTYPILFHISKYHIWLLMQVFCADLYVSELQFEHKHGRLM